MNTDQNELDQNSRVDIAQKDLVSEVKDGADDAKSLHSEDSENLKTSASPSTSIQSCQELSPKIFKFDICAVNNCVPKDCIRIKNVDCHGEYWNQKCLNFADHLNLNLNTSIFLNTKSSVGMSADRFDFHDRSKVKK